jgi:hypothetical protein
MASRLIVVPLIALGLSGCVHAHGPRLELPAFGHLRSRATDSVDITLGALPIKVFSLLMNDSNPEDAAIKELLKGTKRVYLRHYEFTDDYVYSAADIDAVRSQLTGREWRSLVCARSQEGPGPRCLRSAAGRQDPGHRSGGERPA